jgi:ATP-dependent DNA helicase DinG
MLTSAEKKQISTYYQAIKENLDGFRSRPSQREMLAAIANTFGKVPPHTDEAQAANPFSNGENIIVIEGPTGVGKSLAYLLAGAVMAQSRGKKLVVSSATIALQEQLAYRDLPFLMTHSGLDLPYGLAKGRGRYACPYRLYGLTQTQAQGALAMEEPWLATWDKKPETQEMNVLTVLADQFHDRHWDGDRDTLSHTVPDHLWQRITNDRHGCLKMACPNKEECPFFLARDKLDSMAIIVVNHDLLLADLQLGGGVLLPAPDQTFYCVDEAHHLSDKAIGQFAAQHALHQVTHWLEKVQQLAGKLAPFIDQSNLIADLLDHSAACGETLAQCEWELLRLPNLSLQAVERQEALHLFDQGILPEPFKSLADNLAFSALQVEKNMLLAQEKLNQAKKKNTAVSLDKLSNDLGYLMGRLSSLATVWQQMATYPAAHEAPIAKWVSRDNKHSDDFIIATSPVSAANRLNYFFWKKAAGVLLTSATLRSLGHFDLFKQQMGLHGLSETSFLALNSPFDFEKQGELYIPPMKASPKDGAAHTLEIIEWLPKLIDLSEPKGSLVLFTSRRQMEEVAEGLHAASVQWAPHLLLQGDLSKRQLIEAHHTAIASGKASVIFGLDSFAEGLDLPLESCVHVIIAKLPFAMPDDPVAKTLATWLETQGRNPFMELTVPQASIKLIQAVGRLIRTENDYGRVSILDNRLLSQRYGRSLLKALPPFKRLP